jgi:two-component system, cell cycle sensor histidine kinase and response regulator CckA
MGLGTSPDGNGESRRLAALESYRVLDTPEDAACDRITELAARLFETPVALLSLVDRDRVWLKSHFGLNLTSIPREDSLSARTILSDQVMVVGDVVRDPRFHGTPLPVGGLNVRFYAGAPLITPEGLRLGDLAVMDTRPRAAGLSPEQTETLADLAAIAMHDLNLDRQLAEARGEDYSAAAGEAKFRALMESASQAIIAVNHKGFIELVNHKAEELFGYSRGELIGHRMEMLLPERFRDVHVGHRRNYFARPHARPMGIGMDLAGRRKSGQEFAIEISLNYVEVAGEALAISFITDISERIRMEQQLRQSQKMEAVGQLAGGVAHDFNNLLTIIHGCSAMSLEGMAPDDPLREALEEIEKASISAAALTRQLLTFSRRQVLRPKVLDLNAVISQVEKMLRRVIGEDIELTLQCEAKLGLVLADPGSIEQVLMNLVVNARDAMPEGGRLIIETGNLFLDEEYAESHIAVKTGPYAMLAVSDTGTGMTPDVQARIFEPFFTTKQAGAGTGLGLATVYGIVQQMEGTIWVYSEPGKGSTFKILIPVVAAGDSSEPPVPDEPVRAAEGETILLVEDEAGVRRFVRSMLEKRGYRVVEAEDAVQALALASDSTCQIDLLLTDVIMPKMNGPQLAEQIHTHRPQMRTLFMSGYTDRAIRLQDRLGEGAAFIQKPFTPQLLALRIREVLGNAPRGNTADE